MGLRMTLTSVIEHIENLCMMYPDIDAKVGEISRLTFHISSKAFKDRKKQIVAFMQAVNEDPDLDDDEVERLLKSALDGTLTAERSNLSSYGGKAFANLKSAYSYVVGSSGSAKDLPKVSNTYILPDNEFLARLHVLANEHRIASAFVADCFAMAYASLATMVTARVHEIASFLEQAQRVACERQIRTEVDAAWEKKELSLRSGYLDTVADSFVTSTPQYVLYQAQSIKVLIPLPVQ